MNRRWGYAGLAISIILWLVVSGLWGVSYGHSMLLLWGPFGTHCELGVGKGDFLFNRFTNWKRDTSFVLVCEPSDKLVQQWCTGVGFDVASRSGLLQFEVVQGRYRPPFAWQMPPARFTLLVIPCWAVWLICGSLTAVFAARVARRRRREQQGVLPQRHEGRRCEEA